MSVFYHVCYFILSLDRIAFLLCQQKGLCLHLLVGFEMTKIGLNVKYAYRNVTAFNCIVNNLC